MSGNALVRQVHRWASLVFVVVVAGLFAMLGLGREPAQALYFLPLAPLALLAPTGLWLFVLPYLRRGRA